MILCIVASCATIQAPSGGDEDKAAPVITATSVKNGATNFSGNELSFTFDEYISLDKAQQNILISPPLSKSPEYEVKGKTFTMKWEDTLKSMTTYNFYFANVFRDVNERNDTSFSWVLSTGDYIDSLTFSMSAFDARTGEPLANIWLLAYLDNDIKQVLTKKPDFVTQTNTAGKGTFQYLPNKNLRVFALKDENGNLTYDRGSDQIGFMDEAVEIGNATNLKIHVFEEKDTVARILEKKYVHPGLIRFVFNKEMNLAEFWGDSSNQIFENDTAELFLTDEQVVKGNYSLDYIIAGTPETATFYINENLKAKNFVSILKSGVKMSANKPITILCTRPIESFDTSLIALYQDSIAIPTRVKINLENPRELKILADIKSNNNYKLSLGKNAISSFYKLSSDSTTFMINTYASDYFGKLKIDGFFDGRIVQLLLNGKVVRELSENGETISFAKLRPGKYQVRMIEDLDQNGKWTSGSLIESRQAEKVYYYPEIIDLRSGWDQEIIWDFKEDDLFDSE